MSEWWTYRLSDFLLFSPKAYRRLFEIYNAEIWPAQIAAAGLALAIGMLLRRGTVLRGRVICALVAACWLWVAIAFHARRYATINWAATGFAWGFSLEAALWVWVGVVRARFTLVPSAGRVSRFGVGLFVFAVSVEPGIGLLAGRTWRQAEIFGVAPDPTAVGSLGLLLIAAGRGRRILSVVPTIWCAISGATLLAMKAPEAWLVPLAAVLAITLEARREQVGAKVSETLSNGVR
jgi:uncharacterized protein DUF6064